MNFAVDGPWTTMVTKMDVTNVNNLESKRKFVSVTRTIVMGGLQTVHILEILLSLLQLYNNFL